jgi:transitional endoplasmic reticulum ATPase
MSDRQENSSNNRDRDLGLDSLVEGFIDELKQKLNLDQLTNWAEEKLDRDDLKTEVRFATRSLSSIPRRGNIPRPPSQYSNSSINIESPSIPNRKPERSPQTPENLAQNTFLDRKDEVSKTKINDLVGGLGATLAQLKNLVEIPLKHPEILQKLGIEPPKGILLVGAPGTGKTLTARSLAETLGVNFIAIVATEIISKYYGEAEAKLRELFQKAVAAKPCLIFIDEIDALMPNRDRVEGEVEKRVVAQMLGLMDGFKDNAGVIILAATNRPDALDPALRRPGRFDREVIFSVPDAAARSEILAIHSRNMPLASDVDLTEISSIAHGFVGADIKGLCQTAAYIALDRQVTDLKAITPNSFEALQVLQADFMEALKKVKPAVLRSLTLESPQVKWAEIGGLESVKHNLQEAVSGYLSDPELYNYVKARPPRGILLAGSPGTGKTLLAKAIATEAKANFIAIAASELLSKWVGASEQAIKELFTQARQAQPCVIFIDEIDTIAPARGSNQNDSGISDRLIGQMLTELDGIGSAEGILVVAATNRPDSIDPALLRSGRIELHITIDLPDLAARTQILAIHNTDRPCASDLDLARWAVLTEGWNGADLALLSNRAAIFAIRRHQLEVKTNPSLTFSSLQITTADFAQASQELDRNL